LIREVIEAQTRWRVVASVRKYDLRHSPELQQLFRGILDLSVSPELQDSEFAAFRHINVPLFTDNELDQLRSQAPDLDALFRIAPLVLRELLRVPFNLWLMTDMLQTGIGLNELQPIST
jgi:hypothetical protein